MSNLLETLRFVNAAVESGSGHSPHLAHFLIRNGTLYACDGKLAIQAPFPVDLHCAPHAGQLIQAVAACEDVITFYLEAGRLVVKSGKFKSYVNLIDPALIKNNYPTGARMNMPQPIIPVLKQMLPFVANDPTKPWANGIRFANNSAVATNSICIVEHWLEFAFPVIVTLPRSTVVELVRLKLEPTAMQVNEGAVTFHMPGGAWIMCATLKYDWPDVGRVFERAQAYAGPFVYADALEHLLKDVAKLDGFTGADRSIHFRPGLVSTEIEGNPATSIETPFSPGVGIFRADALASLRGMVNRIGFAAYPALVPFYGEKSFRGVMAGFQPQ